jgi:hypothetical protein
MAKNLHHGHEPEHVDLTQVDGEPGARVDPLFERQTDDAQFVAPWFRARFYSDAPVHSPAGIATALLRLVLAASLPAAGMAAGGWAMGVAAWLTLTLAALIFLLVGTVGLVLILRIEPSPHAPGENSSDDGAGEPGGTDNRTDGGETRGQHSRHPLEHPDPPPPHKALQPPRRR